MTNSWFFIYIHLFLIHWNYFYFEAEKNCKYPGAQIFKYY